MGEPFPSDVDDFGAELSFEDMLDEAPPESLRLVTPELHDLDVEGLDDATVATLRAPRWEVADVAGADWAMRIIRKHRATISTNAALAQRQIDRWTAWLEIENKQYVDDIERLNGMLRAWAAITTERRLADVGGVWSKLKPKLLRTPSGKIKVKKSEAGTFNGGNAEVQRLAVEALRTAGFPEFIHESTSYSVRPTELDAAVEIGACRIGADGWYEVRTRDADGKLTDVWVRLPVWREGRGHVSYTVEIDGDNAPADVDEIDDEAVAS